MKPASILTPEVPLRLRASNEEEAKDMLGGVQAARLVKARLDSPGVQRLWRSSDAEHGELMARLDDVMEDLADAEAQTAFLRLTSRLLAMDAADDLSRQQAHLAYLISLIRNSGGLALCPETNLGRVFQGGPLFLLTDELRQSISNACFGIWALPDSILPADDCAWVARRLPDLMESGTVAAFYRMPGLGLDEVLTGAIADRSADCLRQLREGELLPEYTEDVARLRADFRRVYERIQWHDTRRGGALEWALASLAGRGIAVPTSFVTDRDFLHFLLVALRTSIVRGEVVLVPEGCTSDTITQAAQNRALLRWGVAQMLQAPEDLSPAHRRVLEVLVLSPRKLVRFNADPAVMDYKRQVRRLVPAFEGYQPKVECAALLEAIRNPNLAVPELAELFTDYLAPRLGQPQSHGFKSLLVAFYGAMHARLPEVLATTEVVDRLAHLRNADDVEFERLLAEEQANAAPPPIPTAVEVGVPAQPLAEPVDEPVALEFVENLGSPKMRTLPLATSRRRLVDDLAAFLDEHHSAIEPARSITRAIHHYLFEVPDEIRSTWSKENLNGFSWHKLKRGRCRIYIRMLQGRVCFSLINRRDWVHGEAIGNRY